MNANETQCAMILSSAASATHGIVVYTMMRPRPGHALPCSPYGRRVELQPLQIRVSPDDSEHELWIVRRDAAMPIFNPEVGQNL
jgi:hypothetical protein